MMGTSTLLEKLFKQFDAILTPWFECEEEFFAAVLLQTYTWWRSEHLEIGLDLGRTTPDIMHSDIAAIVIHHAGDYPLHPGEDITCVFVSLPSLFQRSYETGNKNPAHLAETRKRVQQEAMIKGMSEIDVLLAQFHTERAFLTEWLRQVVRNELETLVEQVTERRL